MVEQISSNEQSKRSVYSMALLLLVLVFLFIVPLFPVDTHNVIYNVLLTVILIFAALAMDRMRKRIFMAAALVIILEWVAYILDLPIILSLSQTMLFLYFIFIVIGLVFQVATTKKVTARVIVESITGYLMTGIAFSLIIMAIARYVSAAYSYGGLARDAGVEALQINEFIYYGFITYTTLGYGDIVPLLPVSRSLAVLVSVTGQIYLTVIIAMLVGKFLSYKQDG